MSGPYRELNRRAPALTYFMLAVTALATFVMLVQPPPDTIPHAARPIMLAE